MAGGIESFDNCRPENYSDHFQPPEYRGTSGDEQRITDYFEIDLLRRKIKENPKTGLPNEEALKEFIKNYDERQPYSVIATYIDLIGFGEINRIIGHKAADKKLIEFSQKLKSKIRKTDFIFSPHGDEFVLFSLIKPNLNQENQLSQEEGLSRHLQIINNELEVKFDFSSVTFNPNKHQSLNDAVNEADLNLMEKKRIAREKKAQQQSSQSL